LKVVLLHTSENQETPMRTGLISLTVATIALVVATESATAQQRPWCLRTGSHGPTGGLNECSFYTLEQCRASIGGGSDQCLENPDLAWDRREGKSRPQPKRPPRERGY
jgi:hypothetical protein